MEWSMTVELIRGPGTVEEVQADQKMCTLSTKNNTENSHVARCFSFFSILRIQITPIILRGAEDE